MVNECNYLLNAQVGDSGSISELIRSNECFNELIIYAVLFQIMLCDVDTILWIWHPVAAVHTSAQYR